MANPRLRVEPLEDRTVPSRVLVTLSDPARAAELSAPFAEAVTPLGFGTYRVDVTDGTAEAAVSYYAALPGVVRAGADAKLTVEKVSNDPQAASQWGLAAIHATSGWTAGTGTGHTVVAVIDTGVDLSHPDLRANLWRNTGEIANNGIDDDHDGYVDDVFGYDFANNDATPSDDNGHGTHVAGIVGAVGNNGLGVSGVAWKTTIMPLKFMDANGDGYDSDAIRAIDYAVRNGAKVINNSWGTDTADSFLADAIGRARAAGVIVVSAAGNDGNDIDAAPQYPAAYTRQFDNAVAVAATDSTGRLAAYSNYGTRSVLLAAPGSSVLSTTPGGYGTKSGTSMATPFVSGALAVLWDLHPTWTYQQVLAKLRASVDPLASLAGKVATGGQLDLAKLLGASVAPSPPASPPASPPPPATTPARRVVAAANAVQPISDFRTTRIPFVVTGTGTATDVRVTLSLTHARTSDLQIRLTAPDGKRVVLFNRTAGANLTNVTFTAAGLNGARVGGEWVLEIFDVVTGASGTVRGASLSFAPTAATRGASVPVDAGTVEPFGTFAAFDLLPPKPDAVSGVPRMRAAFPVTSASASPPP